MPPTETTGPPPAAQHDDVRLPPRYWWWRRIAAGLGLLFVCIVAIYAYWWREADRRLTARLLSYRELRQPVYPNDFRVPKIPPGKNAAPFLRAVHEGLGLLGDSREPDRWLADPATLSIADESGRIPLDSLRRLRRAFGDAIENGFCDWEVRAKTPMLQVLFPNLGSQRMVSKAFNALARAELSCGDTAAALGLADQLLRHARFVGNDGPLVCMLVSIHVEGMTRDTIGRALPHVDLSDPLQFGHLRNILQFLNDEGDAINQARSAVFFERAFQIDALLTKPDQLAEEDFGVDQLLRFEPLTTPLRKLDLLEMLTHIDRYLPVIEAPDGQTARPLMPIFPSFNGVNRITRMYSAALMPMLDRGFLLHHDRLASRRRLAKQIATMLFQFETGRAPATPDELVPRYLPELRVEVFVTSQPASAPAASRPVELVKTPDQNNEKKQKQGE